MEALYCALFQLAKNESGTATPRRRAKSLLADGCLYNQVGKHLPHFFFFFVVLGFEPRACTLSSFMFFRDRVLRTICSVCLQTEILLISARITGMSHQWPAPHLLLWMKYVPSPTKKKSICWNLHLQYLQRWLNLRQGLEEVMIKWVRWVGCSPTGLVSF
jgi:hypothetical protein